MTTANMTTGMPSYLHFTVGDWLFFQTWQLSSPGAIAGASIALVCICLLERWLAGVGRVLAINWRKRTLKLSGERVRTAPPFVFRFDIPRGGLHALQLFFAYLLMLAIMTFQAAFLISIVVGLAIGEMVFGRMGKLDNDV